MDGPLAFRLLLQPSVAALFAIRDGMRDAREGRPPYFWSLFFHAETRPDRLREGWRAVRRGLVLGAVMDLIFQLIEFRWVYPGELIAVASMLAVVPYLLLRGPANRVGSIIRRASSSSSRARLRSPNR